MGKGSRATLAIPQLQQKNVPIRAFNFSAGAAMFDTSVMLGLQQELLSYEHSGMSLVVSVDDAGISHPMLVLRGPSVARDSCVTTSFLCKGLMAGTCLLKQWSTSAPALRCTGLKLLEWGDAVAICLFHAACPS